MMNKFKSVSVLVSTMVLLTGFSNISFAGEYDGSWLLYDTHGGGFEANLNIDGTASGTHGDSMKHGTWKETDGAAVIHWNTGWTTKISKQNGKYIKTAYKPGTTEASSPVDTSEAKKKN
jgi:hypothetical protein